MRTPHSFAAALLLAGLGLVQPASAQTPAAPRFVDETAASGITTSYDGDWFYIVGGGVAAFDCNGDSYADIVLPGGESKAQLYVNTSKQGGSLTFAPAESGLELDSVGGLYPADVDSDGVTDLLVLRVGENLVMRGLGACKFERANEAWGFDGGDAWTASAALTFERGSIWPTIAVGNYIDRNEDLSPWGSCTDNWLHRPGEAGKFAAPLPLKPSFCALSMLFTDWDKSGTPSLRVSNDREYYEGGQEQMWRVLPGVAPQLLTPADGWKVLRIWGMGIASYDLDSDGYPEYFLTSMADNKLQTLTAPGPKPDYKDVAYARGVTAHRPYTGDDLRPSTAWHAQFDDVNNDGLADLFVAKGNVDQMPDFAVHDPNNLLLQDADGKFVEAGDKAGIANNGNSRGAALVDFNLDGLLDLVVVNRRTGAQVWRNTGAEGGGNWIEVELRQAAPNEDAIGSWIEVKRGDATMRRELTVGGGHAGGQLGWVHFGLGDATTASVAVVWPDGTRSEWPDLAAGGFYVLERDKAASPFSPRD
ncbi:hypothetical protein VW23_007175 [Devosia insulae DS-56]|uniref:ASPIC/UnbV domain-containing protein n=1 Tax=Devosia insulae DS-56 TaxID=1116389 RepID=A0A1E5XH61_9HYPH|nr:CRTAC1 family protein [Devosia insulae]OEO27936.1 hypothetical protein VW23_007175 [Devosia insulae DS-56]